MAYTPVKKFQYKPYATNQKGTVPSSSTPTDPPPTSTTYDTFPKPKPKPRNYQQWEPKTPAPPTVTSDPHDVTSDPHPPTSIPARPPKRPAGSPPLRKAPPPPSGNSVQEMAKKLDKERKERIALGETTPTASGKDVVPPIMPNRVGACFEKQALVEVKACPPPIKPRERAKTVSSTPAATPEVLNWLPTGESMSLTQLANTHSSRFPLRIHLLDGYYGQTTRFTLSSSDIFDIHFAKHTEVVNVRDSTGTDYSVPLNSAIQFGVTYYQQRISLAKDQQPLQMVFKTVEDLMAQEPLPRLVCATSKWSKASSNASVEENELLVVKGLYKRPLRTKPVGIKCYSLKTESKKMLPEECVGNFSVEPERLKMHVYEFAKKLKGILPCKAMMFLCQQANDSTVYSNVPKNLFLKPIIVRSIMSEVSLTATSVSSLPPYMDKSTQHVNFQGKPIKSALTMEIPLDSHLGEIEVEILKAPNKSETEKLYMNTTELLKKANKEPYMILLDKGSDRVNDTQSMFYTKIRCGRSGLGVDYETSTAIYERLDIDRSATVSKETTQPSDKKTDTKTTKATASPSKEDSDSDDDGHVYDEIDYEICHSTSPAVLELAPSSPFHPQQQPLHLPHPISPPHHPPHHPSSDHLQIHYPLPSSPPSTFPSSLLSSPPSTLLPPPSASTSLLPSPPSTLLPPPSASTSLLPSPPSTLLPPPSASTSLLPSPPSTLLPPPSASASYVDMIPAASVPVASTEVRPEVKSSNRAYLQSMSKDSVLRLLGAMNLSQYQAKFVSEQVTGDVLIELNDEHLESELQIKSKIHRVRLMKIIEGQHSAKNIIEGESPYFI